MERPSFRGHLKLVILDLLNEPRHGYAVMSEMEERYGIKLSAGTVYPILSSLKRSGYIEVAETGKREKKTYVITEKGREYLKENADELESIQKKMRAYKLFLDMGGDGLKEAFKSLFGSMDSLTDEQKNELRAVFEDCARRINLILLGGADGGA